MGSPQMAAQQIAPTILYNCNFNVVIGAGAGYSGRARVCRARPLPQRNLRALLRDAGHAQLHVRHR